MKKLASMMSLCACVAGFAGSAAAGIVSTSGSVSQIGAPGNALPGSLVANNAWAWDELQAISLTSVPVELSTNPSNSSAPVPGFLSGLVDSHFIHFDGVPGMLVTGSVTFSGQIIGVQYNDTSLDLTDAAASTGTIYPTFTPLRGFNNWTGADFVDINGSVLHFQFSTVSPLNNLEQVRVFTRAVPTPGALALLGLGGSLAARRRRTA